MFDVMGFGKPLDEIPMLLQPGVLSLAWGSVVRQLAAGLGISLDEVTETYVREPAPEDFDIASGHIAKGTAAALRFEVRGMVDGTARRRARARHPAARRPVPGLAATRPGGRLVPHRGHRRTVLRHGPLPEQPQAATTTTPAWSRRRRASSTPSPRSSPRPRHPDDARLAAGHRKRVVRWQLGLATTLKEGRCLCGRSALSHPADRIGRRRGARSCRARRRGRARSHHLPACTTYGGGEVHGAATTECATPGNVQTRRHRSRAGLPLPVGRRVLRVRTNHRRRARWWRRPPLTHFSWPVRRPTVRIKVRYLTTALAVVWAARVSGAGAGAAAAPECVNTGPTRRSARPRAHTQIITSPPAMNNGPWCGWLALRRLRLGRRRHSWSFGGIFDRR